MSALDRLRTFFSPVEERDMTWGDFINRVTYNGNEYALGVPQYTLGGKVEDIDYNFGSFVWRGYMGNPVVFACEMARMMLFTEARFQYQRLNSGRPGDLWGDPSLGILEKPWPGGTTGDLLKYVITDADFGGNSFTVRLDRTTLFRCRPDWTTMLHGSPTSDAEMWDPGVEFLGIGYTPGGKGVGDPIFFQASQVAHFAPIPDPFMPLRGMSWLTPIVREIMADQAMTQHRLKFFEHGATPALKVKTSFPKLDDNAKAWIEQFKADHEGSRNAYRTLFLSAGSDADVVGASLQDAEFKVTQGAGEPLALDTPIPTPDGWTTMGDIEPGDQVFGRDGKAATVTGASPVHVGRDCYRVTFSDKTSIVADGGHLWLAMDRNTNDRAELTYTTDELRALIVEWEQRGIVQANRIGIPAGAPVQLPARDLLLDPYVLGVWLGDGATAGAAISGALPDLDVIAQEIERRGYTVTRWSTAPDKASVIGLPGGVLAALNALGVLGGKFIPVDYLRASHAQRLDLLRGLMDTDGTVGHIGHETCEYSSKLERLARQVAELARSLGYRVTVSRKAEARSRTGETWRVTFRGDPDVVPFHLPRKAERVATPVHVKNRAIVSIERVEPVPVRCIAVNTPDHLFRAGEGWTLTHNTRIAAAAGVPPVVAGLSEGLQGSSLNAGNFQASMRRFADLTMRPLWRNIAGSLERIVPPPSGSRLWYDDRDVPALKDDIKDAAEVLNLQAQAINTLTTGGYDPETIIAAVTSGDLKRLKHTGLTSVQLKPPQSENAPADTMPMTPDQMPPANGQKPAVPAGGAA